MLRPPCELVVPNFVRAVRVAIAKKLKSKENYTQQKIANILGVSQPVINQYITENSQESHQNNPDLQDQIQIIAEEIIETISSRSSAEKVLSTLCLACKRLRTDGELCQAHKDLVPLFQAYRPCTACRVTDVEDLDELDHRRRLIVEIESLINFITSLPKFGQLIPAVGTQLGLAIPSAQALSDIAAIPGGIVSVKGRAVPVSKHGEFGTSRTTAGVLLMKRILATEVGAVISLRNTKKIRKILHDKGMKIMQTSGGDKNWNAVFTTKKIEAAKADVIADKGEIGLEPVLYLFACDAEELKDFIDWLVKQI